MKNKEISRSQFSKSSSQKRSSRNPPVKIKTPHPCPIHKVGQTFMLKGYNQPEGICGFAWSAIWTWAVMLKNHGDLKWHYEEPGAGVVCCPDGLRPVIFQIERV